MNEITKPEGATRERVISLFRDRLGYRYLGDWTEHQGNSNIEALEVGRIFHQKEILWIERGLIDVLSRTTNDSQRIGFWDLHWNPDPDSETSL
jgi:hypothetical protein